MYPAVSNFAAATINERADRASCRAIRRRSAAIAPAGVKTRQYENFRNRMNETTAARWIDRNRNWRRRKMALGKRILRTRKRKKGKNARERSEYSTRALVAILFIFFLSLLFFRRILRCCIRIVWVTVSEFGYTSVHSMFYTRRRLRSIVSLSVTSRVRVCEECFPASFSVTVRLLDFRSTSILIACSLYTLNVQLLSLAHGIIL